MDIKALSHIKHTLDCEGDEFFLDRAMESLTKVALVALGLNVISTTSDTTAHGSNMTTMIPESEGGEKQEFLNLIDNFLGDLLKYAGK